MYRKRTIFTIVAVTHFVLTAALSAAGFVLYVQSVRLGEAAPGPGLAFLDGVINVLLFPTKALIGPWIAHSSYRWVSIPAIPFTSLIWATVAVAAIQWRRQRLAQREN